MTQLCSIFSLVFTRLYREEDCFRFMVLLRLLELLTAGGRVPKEGYGLLTTSGRNEFDTMQHTIQSRRYIHMKKRGNTLLETDPIEQRRIDGGFSSCLSKTQKKVVVLRFVF